MRDLLDYPLGAFRSAFSTLLGWAAVMVITSIGGFAVGRCIEEVSLVPLWEAPCLIPTLAFYAFLAILGGRCDFSLLVLGVFMGTALGWSLGLTAESFRFRLVIAVVNGAMWAAIGVWVSPLYM
jgi:hypothetical protein